MCRGQVPLNFHKFWWTDVRRSCCVIFSSIRDKKLDEDLTTLGAVLVYVIEADEFCSGHIPRLVKQSLSRID